MYLSKRDTIPAFQGTVLRVKGSHGCEPAFKSSSREIPAASTGTGASWLQGLLTPSGFSSSAFLGGAPMILINLGRSPGPSFKLSTLSKYGSGFTVSSWDDLVTPPPSLQLAPFGLTSAAHGSTAFTDLLLLVGPVLWRQGSHSAVQATTSILLPQPPSQLIFGTIKTC